MSLAPGDAALHSSSHELPPSSSSNTSIGTGALIHDSIPGSGSFELQTGNQGSPVELPDSDQTQAAELPSNGQYQPTKPPGASPQISELPGSSMEFTVEETVALEEIFAEADKKLVSHGRPAVLPSRQNTVRTLPKGTIKKNSSVVRKPISKFPGGHQTQTSAPSDPRRIPTRVTELPMGSPASDLENNLGLSSHNSTKSRNQTALNQSTLNSSVNYIPYGVIEKGFIKSKEISSQTTRWPSNFTIWLRVAEWWFLKVGSFPWSFL